MTSLSTGESYSYDANGNMTCRIENGTTYKQDFNFENLLSAVHVMNGTCASGTGVETTQFVYDGDGNLVKKINPDGSKTIYVGGVYEVDKTSTGTVTKTTVYYPAGGAMRIDGTLYFVLKDHLGSANVVTDANGNVITAGEQRYYPFGEERLTATMLTDRLYTGQRQMTGLGIYHYNARFYSPTIGRFLSADTIVPGYANPQNLNRFSYVNNNPLRYTDPTGHKVCDGAGINGACDQSGIPGTLSQVIKILKSYGASLSVEEGQNAEWSFQNAYKALDAVISIGNSIADTLGNGISGSEAFKSVYSTGVNFMWMPRTCAIGEYTCWGYAGNFSVTNPVIQIYEKYTTSQGFTLKSPITPELFVHELGHAFNVLGGRSPQNYAENYTDRGGAHVLTDNRDGFASGYTFGQDNSASEIFADMFVGWVYGAWASNHAGETRNNVMTTNMADWIIDAQNGH